MPNLTYQVKDPRSVPYNTAFLKDAANLYYTKPEFKYSLVAGLLKAVVNRTNGKGNSEMDEKVINFYQFVSTYSPKATMIVLEKLQGHGERWIQKLNAQYRISCILEDDHNILVIRMKNEIAYRVIYKKTPVTFSLAMYVTNVATLCEVSYNYKAIICGAYPNHKVYIDNISNDDNNVIFDGTSKSMELYEEN